MAPDSIYGVLHRECFNLFPDEMFADLFTDVGRRSVPPMIVAVVMVLQRIEGLSDREAVERFAFDARWKYAAGGLDFDYPGFVHTVLVDMRARLARSDRPNRIFEVTLAAARAAGLVGRKRVLDSTPLYDAVATMDTVTLIRSAIRGLLAAAGTDLERELRGLLRRDDDYAAAGKPVCDYDDPAAREGLVNALACDAMALVGALDGRELGAEVDNAARLLATVVGQDLDHDGDGVFRIARRVAKDRVISTVDPDARHGHKTSARGFDGYKGRLALDPDSEIVTATEVSAANAGDAEPATDLLADELPEVTDARAGAGDDGGDDPNSGAGGGAGAREPRPQRGWPGGLRRLGLRHRAAVGQAGNRGRADLYEGAAAERAGWAVRQGPLHHRPDHGHRHLPRPGERADPPGQGWRRYRGVRHHLRRLPVGHAMHYLTRWPHHHDQCLRATAGPSPRRPGRSRLGRRIQGHPAEQQRSTRPSLPSHSHRRKHWISMTSR